jgi:hypothetical protein
MAQIVRPQRWTLAQGASLSIGNSAVTFSSDKLNSTDFHKKKMNKNGVTNTLSDYNESYLNG